MIEEMTGPGLTNPSHTGYINWLVPMQSHIPPPRFVILAWPNHDPTVSKLHVLLVGMSPRQLMAAVSLCSRCELGAKDCSELVIWILSELGNPSFGRLGSIV
jgi:hypothetical protein